MRQILLVLLAGCIPADAPDARSAEPPDTDPVVAVTAEPVPADTAPAAPDRPVDLVLAVDVAWSMTDEQHWFGQAMPALVDALGDADWTATVVRGNRPNPAARVVGHPGAGDELREAVLVGTTGGIEMSRAMILASLRDHDVVRPGAVLSIVVVSDRNDDSTPPEPFAAELSGYTDAVVLSAIVAGDPPCPTAAGTGWDQLEAVDLLGGVHGDICAESYEPTVVAHAGLTLDLASP